MKILGKEEEYYYFIHIVLVFTFLLKTKKGIVQVNPFKNKRE